MSAMRGFLALARPRAARQSRLHDLGRHPAGDRRAEPLRRRAGQAFRHDAVGRAHGDLLVELVRAPSVTPAAGPALDVLARHLAPAGFSVERPVFEQPGTAPVENLFAAIGKGERHLTLAGHVDVVPPGPEASWRHPPFRGGGRRRGALRPRRGRHEGRARGDARRGAPLRRAPRRGIRRPALLPRHRRRGGRRGERHGEAARLGGGARRALLRRARRRADQREGARRPDQDRPPRHPIPRRSSSKGGRDTPPIRISPTTRSAA